MHTPRGGFAFLLFRQTPARDCFIRADERCYDAKNLMLRMMSKLGLRNANRDRRVCPAVKFVLLLLVAHAFLVSGTHFHRVESGGRVFTNLDSTTISHATADAKTDASGHFQCLLCRLQRGFCAELDRPASILFADTQGSVRFLSRSLFWLSNIASLAPSGRAPPLASN